MENFLFFAVGKEFYILYCLIFIEYFDLESFCEICNRFNIKFLVFCFLVLNFMDIFGLVVFIFCI